MNKTFAIIALFVLGIQNAYAGEVYIVKNLNQIFKQTSPRYANATCFVYPNNDFKCACRFSDNSKLWASKEISLIKGLNDRTIYGNIEACKNAIKKF